MLQGSLFGSVIRAGIFRQASQVRSVSGRQLHAFSQLPTKAGALSGLIKSPKIETHLLSSILGNPSMKVGLVRGAENVPLPCALSFRSFLHSGEKLEFEAGKVPSSMDYEQVKQESGNGVNAKPPRMNVRPFGFNPFLNGERGNDVNAQPPFENEAGTTPMPMDYLRGLLQGSNANGRPLHYQPEGRAGRIPRPMDDVQGLYQGKGNGPTGGPAFFNQPELEVNADIVHIKLMRNNSYVTLTDHQGNRKMSVSAGQVAAKGDKPGRYSGEAAAEYMGRMVKQMKIKSVVVKVSGFTYFKRKKDSILAFKDGYTHSRGDVNPVVYIEDTTRKPHNGCRLPKKRRI